MTRTLLGQDEAVIKANKDLRGVVPNWTWLKETFYAKPCPRGLSELACLKKAETTPAPRRFFYQDWVGQEECPVCHTTGFLILEGVKCVIEKKPLNLWGIQCPNCKAIMEFYKGSEKSL